MKRFPFPRGLFPKIFGWFLGAQLLIACALYLLASATQRGFDERWSEMAGANLEARARAAAIAFENGGQTALREAWNVRRTFNGPRDNFDGPPSERENERENGPERGPQRRGANDVAGSALFVLSGKTRNLATHLIGPPVPAATFSIPKFVAGQSTIWNFAGQNYLLLRVDTARGGHFLGVMPMRDDNRGPRLLDGWLGGGPRGASWPRFLVVALTMGALCFALARYLSDPAIKLSRATKNLAAGDFSTRVAPQMGRRRDELADLGRDFDQMAERIESLLLAQRQLLGDISHEIRSPLTRLSLALELAQQTADGPTREFLARIESETEEINGLIGQLLTLTRLENTSLDRGDKSSDAAHIDLEILVAHVAQKADFEAKSKGGAVIVTHSENCQIVGNGELLHSAIENVVRNAILHGPPVPRVEISLQTRKTGKNRVALVRVRDWGAGVPEDALEAMFRPFYRVAQARDRQSGGTGLGLSITQRAAKFHGGDVRARNAEGGGLEVEISLPLEN